MVNPKESKPSEMIRLLEEKARILLTCSCGKVWSFPTRGLHIHDIWDEMGVQFCEYHLECECGKHYEIVMSYPIESEEDQS